MVGLLFLGLVTSSRGVSAQVPHPEGVAARVDSLFARLGQPGLGPGCSLGISQNGALVYERGYGTASLEHGVAISPASVFRAASLTKQFTAMAILLLTQRGQLSLDDEVREYITELPDFGRPLTIRHLLTHTSGLRDAWDLSTLVEPNDHVEPDDALRLLGRQQALNSVPGTEYVYSNFGFWVLGRIVERVSGQSLRMFSDANIFQPLGMAHTFYHDDPTDLVPNRAVGYEPSDTGSWEVPVQQWSIDFPNASSLLVGGHTGLFTTARDLLIWEQNFAAVRVGTPELVAAMETKWYPPGSETNFYGFGLELGQYRGLRAVGHAGADPGYSAYVVRFPDHGLAISVLCNGEGLFPRGFAQGIADIFLESSFLAPAASSTLPPPVSLSAEQLASKVGLYLVPSAVHLASGVDADLYFIPSSDARLIFVRDGKLILSFGVLAPEAGGGIELTPVSADRFLSPSREMQLDFVPAVDGRAQELREGPAGRDPAGVFQRVNAFAPSPFAPSSAGLRAFAGEYVSPEIETRYTLVVLDSDLVIQIRGREDIVLRPLFPEAFMGRGPPLRIGLGGTMLIAEFERDARGSVAGFTVNTNRVRGLRFNRVE